MIEIVRTDSTHPDFVDLVSLLDADLHVRDGDDHSFYAQFNKIAALSHVLVAYYNTLPVGCGAVKLYTTETGEVKRMFVVPEFRGLGIASRVLQELERWAAELNFKHLILETGKAQPEAISLYAKSGYRQIPNYGQYENIENSVCMTKAIKLQPVQER
jgi:GNAT superfamily N-acetyltransferase